MSPLLFALILAPKPLAAKVAEVLKSPAKFDTKAIAVKGKVKGFKTKTSKSGASYYLLELVDGKASLKVYGGDALAKPPKEGDAVTVTGKYAHERKLGDRVFKDEIDASSKLDKAFGVKVGK